MHIHQLAAELETLDSYRSYVEFLRALAQTGKAEATNLLKANEPSWNEMRSLAREVFEAYASTPPDQRTGPFTSWDEACTVFTAPELTDRAVMDRCLGQTPSNVATGPMLLFVIGSNRGLCGSFHRGVIEKVTSFGTTPDRIQILCIGRHTRTALIRRLRVDSIFLPVRETEQYDALTGLFRMKHVSEPVTALSRRLLVWFAGTKAAGLQLIHTTERPACETISTPLLPVAPAADSVDSSAADRLGRLRLLEPSPIAVASAVLTATLRTAILRGLLRSSVAEHQMRLQESTRAHHYLEEQSESTRLLMRKTRREKITTELVGLLSAAEAYKERD